jgi:hypothetical protein
MSATDRSSPPGADSDDVRPPLFSLIKAIRHLRRRACHVSRRLSIRMINSVVLQYHENIPSPPTAACDGREAIVAQWEKR